MAAPTDLISQPMINETTGGIYADNGGFQTDGNGNISAIGTISSTSAGNIVFSPDGTNVLAHSNTTGNTQLRAKVGDVIQLQDNAGTNFATFSAALANILSLALELSGSTTVATPTGAAQTIATNTGIISRTAPSGACTSAILQPGTVNNQLCIVTNENVASTTNIITFNATIATSNVINDGTNPQVIKCGTGKVFIWLASLNGGAGAWVSLGAFGG